jgi:predicted dienelactone hydrolase
MRFARTKLEALSLVAFVLSACGNDDGQAGATSIHVAVSERAWVDTSRTIPRTPSRTLRTVIWNPETATPVPLLVLAHGFGGLPEKFDAFARAVASAGFLVAAPAFPLTNEDAPGGHENGLQDFRNQPGDVTFVLDRLFEANQNPGDELFAHIDPDRVALLGHSLGGLTALAATRKDCCHDPRIKAVVAVAPLVALFLNQFGADSIAAAPPTLILHGQADTTIAFQSSIDFYEAIDAPKYLVGLVGVDHSEALESQDLPAPPPRKAAEDTVIAFLDATLLQDARRFDTLLDELVARGHIVEADS